MTDNFDSTLKKSPVLAILRGITPEEVPAVCDALYENGILMLEIPLNTPNAISGIATAVQYCAGRQMVGAGTVLTPEAVGAVAAAGGKFIVSPNTDLEVIRAAKRLGLVSIPGFFTASEAFAAIAAGADYLKLFPASLGPAYVKDLKAVVKKPILAVGGVNAGNIPDFLKVCAGVGVGGALYKTGKSLDAVKADAAVIAKAAGMTAAC